jgi:hypothetical protein
MTGMEKGIFQADEYQVTAKGLNRFALGSLCSKAEGI